MSLTKQQAKEAKQAILDKLTKDTDKPFNQAIFNLQEGYAIFDGTDLQMVMNKVVAGLWSLIEKED